MFEVGFPWVQGSKHQWGGVSIFAVSDRPVGFVGLIMDGLYMVSGQDAGEAHRQEHGMKVYVGFIGSSRYQAVQRQRKYLKSCQTLRYNVR